jgi:hypothetical protein
MSVPAYEVMFGKLSLQNLFEDYFDQAGNMTSRIMLKALEDPHVDLIATVSLLLFVFLSLQLFSIAPFLSTFDALGVCFLLLLFMLLTSHVHFHELLFR